MNNKNIENLVSFYLLKKLVEPVRETDAYKLKLVDGSGNVLREPKTKQEIESLNTLQRLVFKLRNLLGTKISTLNKFSFLLTTSDDIGTKSNFPNIDKRSEIIRIKKELTRMSEQYEMDFNQVYFGILNEEIFKSINNK